MHSPAGIWNALLESKRTEKGGTQTDRTNILTHQIPIRSGRLDSGSFNSLTLVNGKEWS